MAEFAGVLLAPFLQQLFEKLLSREFIDLFGGRELNKDLLRDLRIALISVNKLVEDAEDKALVETPVKEWLDELKDAVYDAGDILDEIATKALGRELDAEFEGTASKAALKAMAPESEKKKTPQLTQASSPVDVETPVTTLTVLPTLNPSASAPSCAYPVPSTATYKCIYNENLKDDFLELRSSGNSRSHFVPKAGM